MDLFKIKQIVSREGKVVIADNDDIMVIMSFDEYEKMKDKNLGLSSVLLEAKIPLPESRIEPRIEVQPQVEPQPQVEKPVAELTLDDLPF
ncbi:MAG: hypothetical protein V1819_00390 [bacterium]